ncbi:MAG: pyridoxine/pyridoxamine 5-phosphate oxidase [Actinomycetota bacterium]|jgi:pyridoxamine 5'-phosphate oxidase
MGIADRRLQYETEGLDIDDLLANPVDLLVRWHDQAEAAGAAEPNAMVLSTLDDEGHPDARVVLARDISDNGITFYTNRLSAKGQQIASHNKASATFAWLQLHRSVRVRGTITLASDEASDAYFASRPRSSQIGAWASPQSEVIGTRRDLDEWVEEVEQRFAGVDVPRPPHWGGYVLSIETIEFWQGRPSRLHDRFRYSRHGQVWRAVRLAP